MNIMLKKGENGTFLISLI